MREHIISLRRQVETANAQLVELDKAAGDKPFSVEQTAAFEAATATYKAVTLRLAQAEEVERSSATLAQPVATVLDGVPAPKATASVGDSNALAQPGVPFARFCASLAGAGSKNPRAMADWYKQKFLGDGDGDYVHAALEASGVSGGGILVPQRIYATIAPLLQAQTLMRKSGCAVEPMPNGNTTIVRATGGATFSRVAEGGEANASTPTFGGVTMTAKKMLGNIPISNDILNYAPQRLDQMVTNQALIGIRVAEDSDFLRGNGVGATPKGLRSIATVAAGNYLTMTGTPDVSKVQNDIRRMVAALAGANIPMAKCFFGFHPRVSLYLKFLLNSLGLPVFPEMERGLLRGFPYGETTTIPINLGTGTDSEIYFWDAAECVIGDSEQLRIDISTEASYLNESGTLTSAWSKDQTIIRMILANDFAMFHNAGCCVMDGVTWGA